MLWTLTVVLLVLWLLGMITSYTLGGMLHLILLLALILAVVSLLQGGRRRHLP
jgi:predicted Co/Zn/Cd cation transporter (cation efflux family)